jgi:hypothetical protein
MPAMIAANLDIGTPRRNPPLRAVVLANRPMLS